MIRVLRLMEYEFESNEAAEHSMSHWAVPANGIKTYGKNSIRSAIIINLHEKYPVGLNVFKYDPMAPNLVADDEGNHVGVVTHWNPHGVGEAIIQYFDGSATSEIIDEINFPNGREAAVKYMSDKEP